MRPNKVGNKYGLLLVTEHLDADYGPTKYRCKCDCGTSCTVPAGNLGGAHGTKSCGCLVRNNGRKRA